MNTLHDLLRTCVESPACDTSRLVLADWFDENDMPERAELVRVQVAIARNPQVSEVCPHCGCDDGYNHNTGCLYGREYELLADESKLRFGVLAERQTCPDCIHWKGKVPKDCRCGGTRAVWKHRVSWHRGLPRIECTLAECGKEVNDDWNRRKAWQPSQFLKTALVECGAAVGRVADKTPWCEDAKAPYWWLTDKYQHERDESQPHSALSSIPDVLCEEIHKAHGFGGFLAESAAHDALAGAVSRLTMRAVWQEVTT